MTVLVAGGDTHEPTINPWRTAMHARIDNPAPTVPGVMKAL